MTTAYTRLALALALLLVGVGAPHRLLAQNSSDLSITYTVASPASPTGADFQAGRFIMGFADVNVTSCGSSRRRCQVRMSATAPAGITNMRYVISASLPTVASCATLVPVGAVSAASPLVVDMLLTDATKSARVYFCYDLSWTGTPPVTFTPSVQFRLMQGVS